MGCLCQIVWIHGRCSCPPCFRLKRCPRARRNHSRRYLSKRGERREDGMVDTHGRPHTAYGYSSHGVLTILDHTGSILGTNTRGVHRPGHRQLVLDIWTRCRGLGRDSDIHVSNARQLVVCSPRSLHIDRILFVPETLYFEGNIREQHQARRLSIRLTPFEHAEVPKWSTAFFRPVCASIS